MKLGNRKSFVTKNRRTMRVRAHLKGSATKPRMCVVKSNKHLYVQLIDDVEGKTLASTQTLGKTAPGGTNGGKSKEAAKVLGETIAEKAVALGITQAVFDRGPAKYHGLLAELANAARAKGLQC